MWCGKQNLKIHLGKYYGRHHGVLPSKHLHKQLNTRAEGRVGGAALAQPWGSNYPANKAVGVTLLRQVEWLLSRYLTRQRVGVHGPGEAH